MKFAFVTDLHGVAGLYRQLAVFLRRERPDALLLGGDLFPDGKRPEPHRDQIRFISTYLQTWLSDLRSDLPEIRVVSVLGNHDWLAAAAALESLTRAGLLTIAHHERATLIGDVPVYGYSPVPMTPFWVKDLERLDHPDDLGRPFTGRCFVSRGEGVAEIEPAEHFLTRPSIHEELAALPLNGYPDGILITHCPPAETFADMMWGPRHVGSRGVREFILSRRPRVSLHGHIHEAANLCGTFADRLGDTIVVNPGRTYETLDAVTFEWPDVAGTLRHTRFGNWL